MTIDLSLAAALAALTPIVALVMVVGAIAFLGWYGMRSGYVKQFDMAELVKAFTPLANKKAGQAPPVSLQPHQPAQESTIPQQIVAGEVVASTVADQGSAQ